MKVKIINNTEMTSFAALRILEFRGSDTGIWCQRLESNQ